MNVFKEIMQNFWRWYERHHALNIAIAAVLFTLQLVHLSWLTGEPLADRVFGDSLFHAGGPLRWLIILVDYTEIPALISVSLVYINDLRKQGPSLKPILYLVFLNSQFLHIFWITDEFVVSAGNGETSTLPAWLAYVAILIDYLELPVIYDTVKRMIVTLRTEGLAAAWGRPAQASAEPNPSPAPARDTTR